ncbi:MAG: aspartate carbamoyltransferase regulatory subunit [Candidatus Syntropharchaeia archaeon]
MKKELRVRSIQNGTVIDHIAAGQALNVLKILGITGKTDTVVSMAMNVPSSIMGKKDIVKIENRELLSEEVDKIALIAPNATINIIREYEVVEKHKVFPPDEIEGVIRCGNPNCISNTDEPVTSKFIMEEKKPPRFRCFYCEREIEDVVEWII